jgi:hypothetical protein
MKKLFLLVSVILWSLPAFAQEALWSRAYGGNLGGQAWSVQQTTDGGYIVAAGFTDYSGPSDVYLIKTDSLGDTVWSHAYGGTSVDWGCCVQQTTDGGYIVAGCTGSFGGFDTDIYLIKTDPLGNALWSRTYGGYNDEDGWSGQQTTDTGYILAGSAQSFGAGSDDVYLIKTDSSGDTLWTRTYGGGNQDLGYSVQQTADRGYVVAGWTASFGAGDHDVYLIKTDSSGNPLWSRTYGGSDQDQGYSARQTEDGGYIIVGSTASFGAGDDDVYLIKTDSSGDVLWARTYGGGDRDQGYSVQQTAEGGYVVVGRTRSFGAGDEDVFLIKTDSLGNTLWTRTWGGHEQDEGYCIRPTKDGGYVMAGATKSFGTGSIDFMLTKLDSLGNTCLGEFVSPSVMSVTSTVTSPISVVTCPSTNVATPPTEVTSPLTEVTIVCIFLRGDCTGDGLIDLVDVACLIDYLFMAGPVPDPLWIGDFNCDEVVNIADVIYLINYVLMGGSAPPCC